MSLLLNVIFAGHARSTHHKLALDALKHMQGVNAAAWTDMIIWQHAAYLEGAKAPDDDFKDFKNHVLHVNENFWGGAIASVDHWYGQFVDHLRSAEWKEAAYAAGVLSHYYSDPQMPFHTAQSEAEGAVHRAAEWSVTKSYEILREMIVHEIDGYPDVKVPAGELWLEGMVKAGALLANAFYELLIDHYNLEVGVKNPPAGFDRVAQEAIAKCLAHATVGFARILDRAFDEAAVAPPEVTLTTKSILATMNVPIRKIINGLADSRDRKEVEAIYREVQETGKAIESLPESERLVRQFHAAEVLKVPLLVLNAEKARPAGQKFGQPIPSERKASAIPARSAVTKSTTVTQSPTITTSTTVASSAAVLALSSTASTQESTPFDAVLKAIGRPAEFASTESPAVDSRTVTVRPKSRKYYLTAEAPIVDAPSIGPKTAARFEAVGIQSVEDFIEADPEQTAKKLATRHITVDVIREWQAQSRLMLNIPGLRGHDAQLLVGAKILDQPSLIAAKAEDILESVTAFASTSQGRSVLRDSSAPDLAEVNDWIEAANSSMVSVGLKAG